MKFKKKITSLLAAAVLTTTMATGTMIFADGGNADSTNTQTKQMKQINNKKNNKTKRVKKNTMLKKVAELTGKTEDEIKALEKDGKNAIEIAKDAGVLDKLKAELKADIQEKINTAVKDGKITQDQADKKMALINEKLNDLENQNGLKVRMGNRDNQKNKENKKSGEHKENGQHEGNGNRDGSGQGNGNCEETK